MQVEHQRDTGSVRFALTGEAGFKDGTARSFAMHGLGLLALYDLGANGWRSIVADVPWSVCAGTAIGALLGMMVARLVL